MLVVLGFGAGGFVLRSAVQGDPAATSLAAAPRTPGGPAAFSVTAATSRAVPRDGYLIATARGRRVSVFRSPGGARLKSVTQRKLFGSRVPLVFLVRERRKGWAKVWLPGKPNGSTGWVRRTAVRYSVTRVHLRVRKRARRLDVFEGRRLIRSFPVGVGKSVSPTPRGRYYVTDLVRSTDPDGFYGPYSLGLSAHSPVYTSYAGGNGQIGIHGTDAPEALGTEISAGCIRVANSVVRALADRVPLGAPVDIKP